MIVKNTQFIKSATRPAHYPEGNLPEIAFAGRSNVGKSSLVNVLVNRKNLVRTSSTPGRTQLINFFQVNDDFMLVDLPGYGYAKVPLAVKKDWRPMMETYLAKRENLRGVVLILDIRRVPSDDDLQMLAWLRAYSVAPIIVVTKCDKLSKNERARQTAVICATLGVEKQELTFFSALNKEGKDAVWRRIDALLDAGEGESGEFAEEAAPVSD
ncbi:ribosome biogenesis GTP-binding protein YihA/YsxC [Geomonas subterranea]|uniref:Probable GTP-binding protein EngB n=1 Tax=Geomonas subterranea TaxID=2847989 RepID=A0ABX8LL43_9BACT|nr:MULTISPECIES: ribosome biogenesis GTP-binding protein YihA/YsxC [Geomonas]QXE90285.1 ribosome biogenesis GTP-binding protein YihA/YsxC [Geomonas subterranea]QXM07590.1 ribosome biogenesis GTP-binding protein YihA/YsxC [Geomonas subterranea]